MNYGLYNLFYSNPANSRARVRRMWGDMHKICHVIRPDSLNAQSAPLSGYMRWHYSSMNLPVFHYLVKMNINFSTCLVS